MRNMISDCVDCGETCINGICNDCMEYQEKVSTRYPRVFLNDLAQIMEIPEMTPENMVYFEQAFLKIPRSDVGFTLVESKGYDSAMKGNYEYRADDLGRYRDGLYGNCGVRCAGRGDWYGHDNLVALRGIQPCVGLTAQGSVNGST